MRNFIATLLLVLGLGTPAFAGGPRGDGMDWAAWRSLPVQDGGRRKPLDSLAWESLRMIGNKARFTDPETGGRLDSTAMYLSLLFDWNGWDKPADAQASKGAHGADGVGYFQNRQPDKWDSMPLILVDSLELHAALGMVAGEKYISAYDLNRAEIEDPKTKSKTRFMAFAQMLAYREGKDATAFEKKALEVGERLQAYEDLRMGRRLEVVPLPDSAEQQWVSIATLFADKLDDRTDPGGRFRLVKLQFQQARAAYLADSPEAFNDASANFLATVRKIGPELGEYPRQETIDLEVAYNHWVPFRYAWVLSMIACLCVLASMVSRWKPFYLLAVTAFSASVVAMVVGFVMRVSISGRAPVSNMYESVIYVGLGVAVIGLLFELIYRRQFVLAAASAVATVTLVLADNCPALLDPNLRPLAPVLRNNFWLVIHVMTITLSYAAFALALGIGNIALGYYLVGSKNRAVLDALGRFTYRTLQIGVALLALGTVTGGIWADYSWGRFWGWDPKEVWALIALLAYLAVLHARYIGWVGNRGLAALSVLCFSVVVMAWYGVNFILGAGLHSYGFSGNGGQVYVAGALAAQFLYVVLAMVRPGPVEDGLAACCPSADVVEAEPRAIHQGKKSGGPRPIPSK
ncbi:MAG: cytochrome c biogenesis protein [Pirellulales bacterium]